MGINYDSNKNDVIKILIQEKEREIQSLVDEFEEMRDDITRCIVEKELMELKENFDKESKVYLEACSELNLLLAQHEQMRVKNNIRIERLKKEEELLAGMLR